MLGVQIQRSPSYNFVKEVKNFMPCQLMPQFTFYKGFGQIPTKFKIINQPCYYSTHYS